ncbi:sigma-70 family RNA polymerase sigma factor [Chitinophaga polysaccharea]|uniref:RNA polymerase sigma factor n=1 Tax=Chitinophaga TaxID=79328 RepID=UPI001454EFCD|nr:MULTISPECIES: sigma-70 family RNA polymerase sigma factor [Chitinophaga]NLR58274.1 sigma-70 family RNA polymerase sigma factor [Chitinophaga polysaccharea]NLU90800.1 sigma-70 family RNA polymerase sigma factor [Chitinophaga sp. Ak27]
MINQLSDKEILSLGNDDAAFRVLYERYWKSLYHNALARLGNHEDAQDIVQDIFVSFWRNREHIQTDGSFSFYLFGALRFAIIKHVYRKAEKGTILPLSVMHLELSEVALGKHLELKELQSVLEDETSKLPARMQEIFRLSRDENLSLSEIARRFDISEQTVKNTITTALKRLRSRLREYASLFFLI